jgi:sortase A
MQPNNTPTPSRRTQTVVAPPPRGDLAQRQAVSNITRNKIDQIYQHQYSEIPPQNAAPSVQTVSENPYDRTHSDTHTINQKDWQHYHSAWQEYYQKYYGHYYANAYSDAHSKLQAHARAIQQNPSEITTSQEVEYGDKDIVIDKKQAVNELRNQLLTAVQTNAKKVRKSRHFIPIISGLAVLLLFVLIQYNSNIIAFAAAYTSPGSINPQNIITNPNLSVEVGPDPRLIIPKINVDIGVDYNATTDYDSQMAAMKSSVAYFGIPGANSKPGQLGNVPISGHSSNDFTDSGDAKFIFARLEQLQKGDIFYLNYEGIRYTYTIIRTSVVLPSEVSSLQIGNDKPYATLITCTPLGTAQKRLLVFAEQISPSPSQASNATTSENSSTKSAQMVGKSPTLLERLFGAN